MLREVKYSKIERLLNRLGFEIRRSAAHVMFVHPGTKAVVVISHRSGVVSLHQVVYVRKTLVENELITEAEFDRRINS